MRITRRQLRRIIREAGGPYGPTWRPERDDPSRSEDEDVGDLEEFRDLEPKRFKGKGARKKAEDAAVDLVFDEAERGDSVHVVSLGGGEYGLYFAKFETGDYYEDQPESDPEAETVIQVPRGGSIQYGVRRDWGGSRIKSGRY